MKYIIRLSLVSLLIGIVMTVSGFIMGPNYERIGILFTDYETYGELQQEIITEDIYKLTLNIDDKNVYMMPHDGPNIIFSYYKRTSDEIDIWTQDAMLFFTHHEGPILPSKFRLNFPMPDAKDLTIFVPQSRPIDLDINIKKGTFQISNEGWTEFHNVSIKSNEAYVNLDQFKANDVTIHILDAALSMKYFEINRLTLDLDGHDATLSAGDVNRLLIDTKDSDVYVYEGNYTRIDAVSLTGDIALYEVVVTKRIDFVFESGHIYAHLLETEMITIYNLAGNVDVWVSDISPYRLSLFSDHGYVEVYEQLIGRQFNKHTGVYDMMIQTGQGRIFVNVYKP